MSKIVYAQVSFILDYEPTLENLKAAHGNVDDCVVVEADSAPFTAEQRQELEKYAKVVTGHWGDNFPAFRNRSLEEAQKLGADWVVISDADEHHSPGLWRDLKSKIIPGYENGDKDGPFNQAGIRCFDDFDAIDWWDYLDQLKELPGGSGRDSAFFKNLIFRLYPDVHYEGSGGTIGIGGATKTVWKCDVCGKEETDYEGVKEKLCPRHGTPLPMKIIDTQPLKVHEIWGSVSHPWRTANLPCYRALKNVEAFTGIVKGKEVVFGPYQIGAMLSNEISQQKLNELKQAGAIVEDYYYIHRKSSLRVWHNAARNLFIGGGGDTVGPLNPMWVELRNIASKDLEINDWHSFEKYVLSSAGLPDTLEDWVKRALVYSATDYGTETRETAKWIVFYHRSLLTEPNIEYGIKNPPKPDKHTDNEIFVRKCYFQYLGRHPDRAGLDDYTLRLDSGELTRQKLAEALTDSPEYKQKHPGIVAAKPSVVEWVPIKVPKPRIDMPVSEGAILEAFSRSLIFKEKVLPRLHLGYFILDHVPQEKRELFLRTFYEARDTFSLKDMLELLLVVVEKEGTTK